MPSALCSSGGGQAREARALRATPHLAHGARATVARGHQRARARGWELWCSGFTVIPLRADARRFAWRSMAKMQGQATSLLVLDEHDGPFATFFPTSHLVGA